MKILTLLAARRHKALLALCLLAACECASAGLVIRAGQCSAKAFIDGSGVLADGDNIQGLSVNCTDATSNKDYYTKYLNGIGGYTSYCVATTIAVGKAGGKLKQDALPNNQYHCLLAGKASQLANVLTKH
jgi:hypothetical protein